MSLLTKVIETDNGPQRVLTPLARGAGVVTLGGVNAFLLGGCIEAAKAPEVVPIDPAIQSALVAPVEPGPEVSGKYRTVGLVPASKLRTGSFTQEDTPYGFALQRLHGTLFAVHDRPDRAEGQLDFRLRIFEDTRTELDMGIRTMGVEPEEDTVTYVPFRTTYLFNGKASHQMRLKTDGRNRVRARLNRNVYQNRGDITMELDEGWAPFGLRTVTLNGVRGFVPSIPASARKDYDLEFAYIPLFDPNADPNDPERPATRLYINNKTGQVTIDFEQTGFYVLRDEKVVEKELTRIARRAQRQEERNAKLKQGSYGEAE